MSAAGTRPRTLYRRAARELVAEIAKAAELFEVRCATGEELVAVRDVNRAAGLREPSLEAGDAMPERLRWDWLPASARESGTGLAFVYKRVGDGFVAHLAIAPPFPVQIGGGRRDGDCLGALRRSLEFEGAVAIVDLHAGKSWIGVARDGRLEPSRTVSRYVQRRHRAGGQSASRFQRNRKEWERRFHAKLADALADMVSGYRAPVTWIALAGDQTAGKAWLAEYGIERRCALELLPRSFDSRGTTRAGLSRLAREVWSARLFERGAAEA